MHCEEVRAALLDHLDASGPEPPLPPGTDRHLDTCEECRELQSDIGAMRAQARVWHDLEPPRWNPIPLRSGRAGGAERRGGYWQSLVQQWLPLAASTAALVLAVIVYRHSGDAPAPPQQPPLADSALAGSPAAQALLAVSRQERQREMAALTALLKAELQRQEAETEESLKYLISHQIQSQRELDDMRGRLLQTDVPTEQL